MTKINHEISSKCLLLFSDSFPGLWEVPLVDYNSKDGRLCNFIDSCTPPETAQEAFELFDSNFARHYTTNRAPFFMLLEEQWLANSTYFEGISVHLRFCHLYSLCSPAVSRTVYVHRRYVQWNVDFTNLPV